MVDFKALIFDLDDTAIPNSLDSVPSIELIEATSSNKRFKLCAATGRPYVYAKDILTSLRLTEPCVISAGTQIVNPLSGEILWEVNIAPADAIKILELCQPYDYEIIFNNEMIGHGRPASDRVINGDINVMYVIGSSIFDAEVILKLLKDIEGITAIGIASWTHKGIDIHITHRDATKEQAIGELLRMINVEKKHTIGVGDANNDIHLFEAVGHKVAMGNATELLKSKADEVADTVGNDGLAKIIEKYNQ